MGDSICEPQTNSSGTLSANEVRQLCAVHCQPRTVGFRFMQCATNWEGMFYSTMYCQCNELFNRNFRELLAPEDRLVGLSNQNSRLDHLFLKEHDNCFTCPPFGVSVNVLQSDLKYTHVDLPF